MKHVSTLLLIVALTLLSTGWIDGWAQTPEPETSPFLSTTIDIGLVCSSVEKSKQFYIDALGFREVPGFEVNADFALKTGLSNNLPLKVTVLVLGEGPGATKLKLMEFPEHPPARVDQSFLHSTYGYRYLTILVRDVSAAVARAAEAGQHPIAQGPQRLPEPLPQELFLANFRDPDGNLVELVGPMP